MADIFHDFPIEASTSEVFRKISTPQGLDGWWSKSAAGEPGEGAELKLGFGPGYDWRAIVSRWVPDTEIEYEMTVAADDWLGTRVGFRLEESAGLTKVSFRHTGWAESSKHFRTSSFCWAMYLRILKRWVERGEVVPYERRLEA
jgi:uncharacterized protein YndB with AHSA1/START domain